MKNSVLYKIFFRFYTIFGAYREFRSYFQVEKKKQITEQIRYFPQIRVTVYAINTTRKDIYVLFDQFSSDSPLSTISTPVISITPMYSTLPGILALSFSVFFFFQREYFAEFLTLDVLISQMKRQFAIPRPRAVGKYCIEVLHVY